MSIEQRQTQSADGTTISYRVAGPQGGAPVVLIHGWMMSAAVWEGFWERLPEGHRYIMPDMRGSGGSSRPEAYSHARLAEDTLACMDAEGIVRAALIGHSMGGQLAQFIAATHPERVSAIALVNAVPASGMQLPPEADGLFFGSGGSRELQGTILNMATKQLATADLERLLDIAGAIAPDTIQRVYRLWTGANFADQLGKIEAPALVLATDDPFLPVDFLREATVKAMKRARLVYLPGPGHYPQIERPAECAAILSAFLAGVAA